MDSQITVMNKTLAILIKSIIIIFIMMLSGTIAFLIKLLPSWIAGLLFFADLWGTLWLVILVKRQKLSSVVSDGSNKKSES